ncbi:type IV secretion protein Rhs [Candidatus Pantoea formicae]|uniref:type IV secretion protein Rhs n=1 Tax=Candidatus Pantoea formicae TaxID=2608355 RepID=UPI003ED9DDA3
MLTKGQHELLVKEGTLRLMTHGEIVMAREVFGHSIAYNRVWVHCDSYLPFGLQGKHVGMSPNGEIYFRKEEYLKDFSLTSDYSRKHFFMHELAHVWQHQQGQWVRMRGMFSWAADYRYQFDKSALRDFSLEQQASIIADYWLLIRHGLSNWRFGIGRYVNYVGPIDNQIKSSYEHILNGFLRLR